MGQVTDEASLGSDEALLLETYGIKLLAFLCATDVGSMRSRLEGTEALSSAAEQVMMSALLPLARQVAAQLAGSGRMPPSLALQFLLTPSADGTSLGVQLHRAAGGEIPDDLLGAAGEDRVKQALAHLAIAAYPLLLAPTEAPFHRAHLSLYQHPLRRSLQDALQEDPVLTKLFTEDDPGLGRSGTAYTSLGTGGGYQDVMFGEMLIGCAWDVATIQDSEVELHTLVTQVMRNVDDLREAASGGTARVPQRVSFTGFITEGGQSIRTPWGPLRPIRPSERDRAPGMLHGAVSGTDATGKQVSVAYAGEMVLETSAAFALRIVPGKPLEPTEPPPWPSPRAWEETRRRVECIQLAILLATERPIDQWATARQAWTWTGSPLSHGPALSWADSRSMTNFMPTELSSDECDAVGTWIDVIDQHWTPRIDIAVRRLLSAANTRTDPADRLVDAVIVWESLFGTSQGEIRLRVSSAMAWLLAADYSEREALQSRLRKIYDDRSQIVHGGRFDDRSVVETAGEALAHARECLRRLLRDRPEVLALPDGAARSARLLLGG
jgi:hypothetical protein